MMLLCLLVGSWLLLRLEGKTLRALGFDRPALRLQEFAQGFSVMALAALAQQWLLTIPNGTTWEWDTSRSASSLATSRFWHANSVAVEELLFRGYLLYQALRWLGPNRSLFLSAAAFGVYHWFSFGVIGNVPIMGISS